MTAILYQQVDIVDLEQQLVTLKEKYINYFNEVEKTYPLKWHIEKDDKNYYKPYTTMACTKLEESGLNICFLLHHIQAELNQKHAMTNYNLIIKVSSVFLEFLLLHELCHLNQFCEGLTIEEYNAIGKYSDNPYEKEANEFALKMIKTESESNYILINFILDSGKLDIHNQEKWIQKIN